MMPGGLKSKPEESAYSPLDIMYGEALLVTDIGEIEYHGDAAELIAPLADDGTAPSDDGLGEMVVKWYAGIIKSHRCFAIDDERGQSGYV